MKRSSGKQARPLKVLIYGAEGAGKTTWAAGAPGVKFIDLDRGSYEQDVDRIEVDTFDEVLEALQEPCKTIVVDSLSRLEALITVKVCGTAGGGLAEYGGGYGKGDDAALQHWRHFLGVCDQINATKNVILVAHALVKPFTDPLGLSYDRFAIALREKAAGTVSQWVNYALFARVEVSTRLTDKKKSIGVTSGLRYLYTDANPAYAAKHRGNLPAQLPLSWQAFADAVEADRVGGDDMREEIAAIITTLDEATAIKASAALAAAKDTVTLAAILGRLNAITEEKTNEIGSR